MNRVTKVCLFILLVPMSWRMVDKANSMFKRETAARKAAAKSLEPDDLTAAAAAVAQLQSTPPAGPRVQSAAQAATEAVAVGDAGSPGSSCKPDTPAGVHEAGLSGAAADIEVGYADKPAAAATATAPLQQQLAISSTDSLDRSQLVITRCWQYPSKDPRWSCKTDPGICQTVQSKLVREQARMVPPFQCGLLVLLLADVAVASLLAGYMVS